MEERDSTLKDLQHQGHVDILARAERVCIGLAPEGVESRVVHKVGQGRMNQYESLFCNSRVYTLAKTSAESGSVLLGWFS